MAARIVPLLLVCLFLLSGPFQYTVSNQSELPSFLKEGSFAQYEQEFSTGDTHELRWEVTSIEQDSIGIEIHSKGLVFNATTKRFDIVPGGGLMIVNKTSLLIHEAFYTNGTEMSGYPVGEKIAFWIPQTTNESTPINSMYETNAYPTSVGPLGFDCLSSDRLCWMTDNVYSYNFRMKRYYDQQTGIVLMIDTFLKVSSSEISILETLNATNINDLLDNQTNPIPILLFEVLVVGTSVIVVVLVVVYYKKWKRI